MFHPNQGPPSGECVVALSTESQFHGRLAPRTNPPSPNDFSEDPGAWTCYRHPMPKLVHPISRAVAELSWQPQSPPSVSSHRRAGRPSYPGFSKLIRVFPMPRSSSQFPTILFDSLAEVSPFIKRGNATFQTVLIHGNRAVSCLINDTHTDLSPAHRSDLPRWHDSAAQPGSDPSINCSV